MATAVSGNMACFINGVVPKPALVCPTLDPEASIQISDELIGVYQSRIDAMINQLGKNVLLQFTPISTECPNCWTSGAMISTPNGPRQIQDMNPGDLVFSHSGNVCKVIGRLQSTYEGRLFSACRI